MVKYQTSKTKKCVICGKDFYYKHVSHTTCGRKCGIILRDKNLGYIKHNIPCFICGKTVKVKDSKFKSQKHVFCSRECYGEHRSSIMKTDKNPTLNKGHTLKTRKKISKKAAERMTNKKDTKENYKISVSGKRKDLGDQFFRSSWEANYARYLNFKKEKWEFEPKTFFFKNVKRGALSYTPDFFVDNKIIEIKGYFNSKDRGKINRFKKQYPKEFEKLWFIIQKKGNNKTTEYIKKIGKENFIIEYSVIEKEYKKIIPHWEFSTNSSEKQTEKRDLQKIVDRLETSGYVVLNKNYLDVKYLFGIFNLMAVKKGSCVLINVSRNTTIKHSEFQKFSKDYHNNGIEIWRYIYTPRRGFQAFNYRMGMKIETDERKKK